MGELLYGLLIAVTVAFWWLVTDLTLVNYLKGVIGWVSA